MTDVVPSDPHPCLKCNLREICASAHPTSPTARDKQADNLSPRLDRKYAEMFTEVNLHEKSMSAFDVLFSMANDNLISQKALRAAHEKVLNQPPGWSRVPLGRVDDQVNDLAVERHEAKDSTANPTIDELLRDFVISLKDYSNGTGRYNDWSNALTDVKAHLRTTILAESEYAEKDLESGGVQSFEVVSVDTLNKLLS